MTTRAGFQRNTAGRTSSPLDMVCGISYPAFSKVSFISMAARGSSSTMRITGLSIVLLGQAKIEHSLDCF